MTERKPAPPIIPTPNQVVQPAIAKLVELRPRALSHIDRGRYGHIMAGWAAQARLQRARLASECSAVRLPDNTGRPLRDLVKSEYWAEFDETPRAAIGSAVLRRTLQTDSATQIGVFARGTIPAGKRLRKVANAVASPPVEEATYRIVNTVVAGSDATQAPVNLGGGQWEHTQDITVPIEATSDGPGANVPLFDGITPPVFETADELFEVFEVLSLEAAGGGSTLSDAALRILATASYTGRFGPTRGSLIATTIGRYGVEHVSIVEDPSTGIETLYIADGTWSSSTRWAATIQQAIKDSGLLGFGCKLAFDVVRNFKITVNANVLLADPAYSLETSKVTDAAQKALRSYFDDRQDFWDWRTTTIGAELSNADFRVLTVSDVAVTAFVDDGSVVEGNILPLTVPAPGKRHHYYLADDALQLNFTTTG